MLENNMRSRTYYGEYSLEHWVKLMSTKNIGLPQYQRSFVWNERDVTRLLSSMKDGQFVQPVTIALNCDSDDSEYKNLILDGQQRLSAILLAYYKVFPVLSPVSNDDFAHEEEQEDDAGDVPIKQFNWTFADLVAFVAETTDIQNCKEACLLSGKYKDFSCNLNRNFFKKTYLGFSYIVPSERSRDVIQQGFTKLFRNINYFGKNLSSVESRRSLYYTQKELLNYFEGLDEAGNDVLCHIGIYEQMQSRKIDFLRYISILSEYFSLKNNDGDFEVKNILKGYSPYSSRETYYADYVSYILGLDEEVDDKKFKKFDFKSVFPNNTRIERYALLKDCISQLKPKMKLRKDGSFSSWIDADYWLFGLVYHIVFMGKRLKADTDPLGKMLDAEIQRVKKKTDDESKESAYAKSPNRLTYLRNRISSSIKIYANYVQ